MFYEIKTHGSFLLLYSSFVFVHTILSVFTTLKRAEHLFHVTFLMTKSTVITLSLEEILNFLGQEILQNVQDYLHILFMVWTFPTPGNWYSIGKNFRHISCSQDTWHFRHISITFPEGSYWHKWKILENKTGEIMISCTFFVHRKFSVSDTFPEHMTDRVTAEIIVNTA